MATVNFRVDEDLKRNAYSVLADKGINPTEFYVSVLSYVADTGKLPVQSVTIDEDEAELLALVRKRLADDPSKFKEITLDDL